MLFQFTYKTTSFSSQNWQKSTCIFLSDSSGKEKDSETGYHYFGARYYNSDLSLWLSVDPMSDKYPSLSPYNYCAWNPMKIVDPDGMETIDNDDGWLVNHEKKTVTRISDVGGNRKQYATDRDGHTVSYEMGVGDLKKMYQSKGYTIKESSSSKIGSGIIGGSSFSSILKQFLVNPAIDNFQGLQHNSDCLGLGIDYSSEISKLNKISRLASGSGKLLGTLGFVFSAYQLTNDNNIEDATFHSMDIIMGGVGTIPHPVTFGLSVGWGLFGRQTIKSQAESFKRQIDAGFNPGHCSYMPFK